MFGSTPLLFAPRSSLFGVIHAIDSSQTRPMSHHKHIEWLDKVEIGIWCLQWHIEWLDKVEIGIWCLQWSPQPVLES